MAERNETDVELLERAYQVMYREYLLRKSDEDQFVKDFTRWKWAWLRHEAEVHLPPLDSGGPKA